MLVVYIVAGIVFLVIVTILIERFLRREKRWKLQMEYFAQRGDYIMAIDMAKRLINLRNHNPEYHIKLAELYEKAKMKPAAINVYENMLKKKIFSKKWKEHNIREKIALLNLEDGKVVNAFKELYIITNTHTDSPLALGLLGRIYGSQLKYDKAKQYLKKAISLAPDVAEFHYLLGLAYLDTGDLSQGIQELDTAYKLDPSHIKAQYFLALASRQKGLTEKAQMLFKKLNITDTSNLPDNVTQLGIMAQNVPKFDIEAMEQDLESEIKELKARETERAKSIEELLSAGTNMFHNTAIRVITRLGYVIKNKIKNRLIDPDTEVDFIAIPKKYKDDPRAPLCYIQFNRTKSEIGSIPFADFISKMKEAKAQAGIFITTSSFSKNDYERIGKERLNITLIDGTKLTRYL